MYRAAFGRQGFAAIGRQGMVRAEAFGREMGLTTWISIAGTDQEALAHGEVAATSAELQRILRTLSAKGIRLIAIRNHMTDDQHPFYFVGFWKEGRAVDLAMSSVSDRAAIKELSCETYLRSLRVVASGGFTITRPGSVIVRR